MAICLGKKGISCDKLESAGFLTYFPRKIHCLSRCHHCHCFDHEHGKRESNDLVFGIGFGKCWL